MRYFRRRDHSPRSFVAHRARGVVGSFASTQLSVRRAPPASRTARGSSDNPSGIPPPRTRLAAMRGCGDNQHDVVARRSCGRSDGSTVTPSSGQRRSRFLDMARDLLLGHAGIMFERHARRPARRPRSSRQMPVKVTTAPISVRPRVSAAASAAASKARAACGRSSRASCLRRHRRKERDLARAGDLLRPACTCLRSMRGADRPSDFRRHRRIPRRARPARRSDRRRFDTSRGSSTSSSVLPMRSRTQAK